MILHSLEFSGISTAFPGEVSIDFDELGEGLIAFVGENGNGKTHAMELSCPATIFRKFPSYGDSSFHSHLHSAAKIASSKLVFSTKGHRYEIVVKHDTGAGKTRAWLYRDGGDTPIAGPERLGDVDAALEKIVPSYKVILASSFASQSREGSFGDLPKAKKKELFMELLGFGRLEAIAAAAKARRLRDEQSLETIRPQVTAGEAKAARAADINREIDETSEKIDELTEQLDAARAAQTLAVEKRDAANAELQRLAVLAESYGSRKHQLTEAAGTACTAETEATNALEANRQVLASAAEVEAAHERCQVIEAAIDEAQRTIDEATEKRRPLDSERATLQERRSSLLTEYQRIKDSLESAREADKRVTALGDLEASVSELKSARELAKEALNTAETLTEQLEADADRERAAASRRASLIVRRADLEKSAQLVKSVDIEHPMCSECPAISTARDAALQLKDIDNEIEELTADRTPAKDAVVAHREKVRQLRTADSEAATALSAAETSLAGAKADIEKAATVSSLQEQLNNNVSDGQSIKGKIEALDSEVAQIQNTIEHYTQTRTDLVAEKQPLSALAESIATVTAAKGQSEQLEAALTTATARRAKADKDLAELGDEPDLSAAKKAREEAQADVEQHDAKIASTTTEMTPLSATVQRLTGERSALGEDPAGTLAALQTREKELERDAADWAQIERAFGKDGVQALEIDAAGPPVTAIANDLLSACYGTRFQLRLDTTKPGAKGGVKEVFEWTILDSEAPGQERDSGSPGEQAIIDEAERLAICLYNTQTSGIEMLSLWRDETGAALSPKNASRYIHMLRRAREIGGFRQVFFISHSEAIWSQADHKLFFADGKVSTTPPTAIAA